MRSYLAAWNGPVICRLACRLGMNPQARWDAMVMYDKRDINGTELRVFTGNFLFSRPASSRHAGPLHQGHFRLPMRNCTVRAG